MPNGPCYLEVDEDDFRIFDCLDAQRWLAPDFAPVARMYGVATEQDFSCCWNEISIAAMEPIGNRLSYLQSHTQHPRVGTERQRFGIFPVTACQRDPLAR